MTTVRGEGNGSEIRSADCVDIDGLRAAWKVLVAKLSTHTKAFDFNAVMNNPG
jgi:hypothetical protein